MKLGFEQAFELISDNDAFHDFLDRLAVELGAKGYAAGWAGDSHVESMFAIKNDWSDSMIQSYFAEFAVHDPWTRAIMQLPASGDFLSMHDLVGDREFLDSALYNDLLRPGGDDTAQAIANRVDLPSGGTAGLTFYRGKNQKPFASEQTDRLNFISGDLSRLLALKAQIHEKDLENRDYRLLLDRKNFPIFILNSSMKIVSLNSAAESIVEQGKGLKCMKGRLVATMPERDAALRGACRAVLSGSLEDASTVSISCGNIRRNFVILAAPNPGGGHRVILIGDTPRAFGDVTKEVLRDRFRLSPAESELLCMLASGCSTKNAAVRRGVSIETIRTQYRSAIEKMNCANLVDAIISVRQLPSL